MSSNKTTTTTQFSNLSGAPPWYVKQYEPDPDDGFPLSGFITKDLPSPFPKPESIPARAKKRKLPPMGNVLQLLGAIVIFFWAFSVIRGGDPPGLNRSYRHDPSGQYVYLGADEFSTPVPDEVPFTPVPTVYATPFPSVRGTPAWYRDDETGAITYMIATVTPYSSFSGEGADPTRELTDRELGMEGVEPIELP